MQCDEEEESWRRKNHTFDVEVGEEGKHEGKGRSCRERLEGDEQCGDAERMNETVGVSAGFRVT